MRATFGQYTAGDKQTRRDLSRMWFMDAARATEPQLTATLFEIYKDFEHTVQFDFGTTVMQRFIYYRLDQLAELMPSLVGVRRSVEGWATRFNLTRNGTAPDWILQCAFRSLSRWQRGQTAIELALPGVSEILPYIDYSIQPPEFNLKCWNPFFGGPRSEFEKDLKAHLKLVKEFVIRRLGEIEKEVEASRCNPAATNLNLERYRWAVWYQVAGIEVADFKEKCGLHREPRGTRDAIKKILDEVGLTRRPPSRIGRPKKGQFPTPK